MPGTSSTPRASCSAACAPRSPACCGASTSRSSPPTSTPATTSSSSTPTRSCSPSGKADAKQVYRHSGYPGGLKQRDLRRAAGPQARGGRAPLGAGHAPEGPARPPDAEEAQGVRRARASARRPAAQARSSCPRPRLAERERGPIVTKPLIQTTGRRKEAVARVRLRPGTGTITVNRRPFEDYFPSATHRMVVDRAAAGHEHRRGLRHRRHARRRRRHRPGRRAAPRHRPGPRRARPRAAGRR